MESGSFLPFFVAYVMQNKVLRDRKLMAVIQGADLSLGNVPFKSELELPSQSV